MSIELSVRGDVVWLPVNVQPGAASPGLRGEHAGRLKVAVDAPPERGKANKALLRLLAKRLGLRRSALQLVSGATSRDKIVAVELAPAALIDALVMATDLGPASYTIAYRGER